MKGRKIFDAARFLSGAKQQQLSKAAVKLVVSGEGLEFVSTRFMTVDGHSTHESIPVGRFVEDHANRIGIFFLYRLTRGNWTRMHGRGRM